MISNSALFQSRSIALPFDPERDRRQHAAEFDELHHDPGRDPGVKSRRRRRREATANPRPRIVDFRRPHEGDYDDDDLASLTMCQKMLENIFLYKRLINY